jgi:hypothetical protein
MRKAKRIPKNFTGFVMSRDGLFVYRDGIKIAYRGEPDTPQAKTWVSLEPGFTVLDDHSDGPYGAIVVEYKDPHAH